MARYAVRTEIIALVTGSVMITVNWLAEGASSSLPPGVVILAVAGAILLPVRHWIAVLLGVAAGLLVVARLLDRGNLGLLLLTALVAATIAVIAGVIELVAIRRRSRRDGVVPDRHQTLQITALLLFAPICAEYLSAYDDSTGDPLSLLAGLVIFVPLYGAPALLIREVARRAHVGWVGIVLMAAAAALIQAGLVDQSLFSTDYRQIAGWEETYRATLIESWGVSAFNLSNFAGGHVVYSFCAPIALTEGMRPATATRPWLSRVGLGLTAAAYLGACALVLNMHLTTEASHASVRQVVVTATVVVILVLGAIALGRHTVAPCDRAAPRVGVVMALSLVPSGLYAFGPETWLGVGMGVAATVLAVVGIWVGSRAQGWGVRHIAAVAISPLILRAFVAFTYDSVVGEVAAPAKYSHNAAMLAIVVAATVLALRRQPTPGAAKNAVPRPLTSAVSEADTKAD